VLFALALGLFLELALGLLLDAAAAFLLGAAARLLGAARLVLALARGIDHRLLARVLVGANGALERAHAAGALLVGEAPRQHHRAPRRLGRGRRCRRRLRGLAGWRRIVPLRWAGRCALAAHFDLNRLGAPMRETLPHLACLDRLAQLEATAGGAAQTQRAFGVLIAVIGH